MTTFFQRFDDSGSDLPLEDLLWKIKDGEFKSKVEIIRSLDQSGQFEARDSQKRRLPAFTPSATFSGGHKRDQFKQYSQMMHFDFDDIPDEKYEPIFQEIKKLKYTFGGFRSPTGHGIKMFVKVPTDADKHPLIYSQYQKYLESILGISADEKCKDITRLCFVSYDPDAYINPDSEVIELQPQPSESRINGVRKEYINYPGDFESCVRFTENRISYYNGNRNNFIYQLACNCNREGLPEAEIISQIGIRYDLPIQEIKASVESAYKNNIHEFSIHAKCSKLTELQNDDIDDGESDHLKQISFIPSDIFTKLPDILLKGCFIFDDSRERDVFLTAALTILSGCLPGVIGVYAKQTVYSNLFSFIIAPAASGKGVLKFAKMLADEIHDKILAESRKAEKHYLAQMNALRSMKHSKKNTEGIEGQIEKPPMKVLFIPANSSYAKILWHLDQNQGSGIICETEADTLGNVLKQDWGAYSDMLRKAFHNERLSSSKKANNEYLEIIKPRLSVALSGTPSQVFGLIPSSEDGLFSRFLFYSYRVEPVWRDVAPGFDGENLDDYFKHLSEQVALLFEYLTEYETIVELTPEQWNRLNSTCTAWLHYVTVFNGDEASSIVKRLGLIMFRITMILTAIRKFEGGNKSTKVFCTDQDFDTAMQLSKVYIDHSIFMFNNLPKQEKSTLFKRGSNKQAFFDELLTQFKRVNAVELGKKHGLGERTVDKLLKKLLGEYLKQESYGTYTKINKSLN